MKTKKVKYQRYVDNIDFSTYNAMKSKYGLQPDGSYVWATEYGSELMTKEWLNCIERHIDARDALKTKVFKFKKSGKRL